MNNKQRIVDAAVELMNRDGSAVGTRHLAEHLSISPGNLYYHFPNREAILVVVLARLQSDLDEVFVLQGDEVPNAKRLAEILIGGSKVLWRYRFLFSSSFDLITKDKQLAEQYRQFCTRGIAQSEEILSRVFRSAPGPLKLSASELGHLAEVLWVVWTSWPRYIETVIGEAAQDEILRNHRALQFVLKPYLSARFYKAVDSYTSQAKVSAPGETQTS